jgi:hypothetical protein
VRFDEKWTLFVFAVAAVAATATTLIYSWIR